jgi:hypothetical protein
MEQAVRDPTTTLRIGTWNVEHASPAKNSQRLGLIQGADADIWVLTETQDGLSLGSSYNAVHSEPRPKKPAPARWVTIWSSHPLIERVSVLDPGEEAPLRGVIRGEARLRHTNRGNPRREAPQAAHRSHLRAGGVGAADEGSRGVAWNGRWNAAQRSQRGCGGDDSLDSEGRSPPSLAQMLRMRNKDKLLWWWVAS